MARPRKPIRLHSTEGTFRGHRHAGLADVVADGEPIKPKTLKGEASEFWDRVVPGLVKADIAKACDTPALAAMCEWWARYQRYSRALDRAAAGSQTAKGLARMADTSCRWFEKLAGKFGLTPQDRARLRTTEKQPVDKFAEFLAGRPIDN